MKETMLIKDLAQQHRHFIPMKDLPMLPEDDTLSDALDVMRDKRTHLVAIQNDSGIKFLWAADMLDFCLARGPVIPWSTPISTIAAFLPFAGKILDNQSADDLFGLFAAGDEAVLVVEADRDGELVGVATKEENAEGFILTLPSVAECIQGHLFATPAPRDCPFDGTPIM